VETSFIVTFIGDDKPGLVEQLSRAIEENGGNWHESRLSQLGGKFAGLILVSLPEDKGPTLEESLKGLSASGLSVRVTATSDIPATSPGLDEDSASGAANTRQIGLSLVGPDRPGIVREVSRALAERKINVLEMDSEVSSAPMSAEPLFQARLQVAVPGNVDIGELQDGLEDIANAMTLDIDID
jgi:glycine cleavage system regulatory protein